MNIDLRKKEENDFKKYLFKLMNNAVVWKTMDMVILNFLQQKEEGIVQYHNQIINYKVVYRKCISNRNEKDRYLWISMSV